MFRSQTDQNCAQCLTVYARHLQVSRNGTGRKNSTEQDVEGTGVNQNQLMSLSADLRLLFQSKLIIIIREEN